MNDESKILLSAEEQELVTNTEWILTKRRVIEKTDQLLGAVALRQQQLISCEKDWLPAAVLSAAPKIARGENYLGLPYLILDHPRCFNGEDIFAVRTMFWWGNFFSITLHLSGSYKTMFQQRVLERVGQLKQDVFIGIHENQWQHHFAEDNYRQVKRMGPDELRKTVMEKQFLKLAISFPLQAWNDMPVLLEDAFAGMITMLKN